MMEILLSDLVFHGRVLLTPVSILLLKPLLKVIGAILLKFQVSLIILTSLIIDKINSY